MCILNQAWYLHSLTRVISTILLFILLPLSLWVALIPLDHIVDPAVVSDKVLHFSAFFGFAVLIDAAFKPVDFWFKSGLPLAAYGAVIEILQSFTPYRSFSGWDCVADIAGVMVFYLILIKCKKCTE